MLDPKFTTLDNLDYDMLHFLAKKARLPVSQTKWKYDTLRVYCHFGYTCLLDATHPGWHHYGPYPRWLMKLDIHFLYKIVQLFNFIVIPFHKRMYRKAYKAAVEKFPEHRDAILRCADFREELEGL